MTDLWKQTRPPRIESVSRYPSIEEEPIMLCPVCGLALSGRCENHGWPASLALGRRWRAGEGVMSSAAPDRIVRMTRRETNIEPNTR